MPRAALKPCATPGCPELVRHGHCEKHRGAQPNYHDRNAQRLYNTWQWRRLRAAQLAKEPWCEECLRANLYTPATDVDHVEPHRGDPTRFFTDKLQSLCHACHSRKTAQEVLNKGRGMQKVTAWGAQSGRGHPHEKISPIEPELG